MDLKKLSALVIIVAIASACTKRDDDPRKAGVKPPTPPTGNVNQKSQDLVIKDNQRREQKRQELVTTNPDISRAPIIRKPRLDDIVAVNLSANARRESLQNLKLSVIMTVKNQIVSVKLVSKKPLSALGPYQQLSALDKDQKVTAEARCLSSCNHVLVRVRRANSEETAFVFNESELAMIPDLEKDPNAERVRKSSRLLEIGYGVSDSLEMLQKSTAAREVAVKGMLAQQSGNTDLLRASELLATVSPELLGASNDVYDLSRLSVDGGIATPEQLSAGDQKLLKASQSLAEVRGLMKQEPFTSEIQKDLDLIKNQLRQRVQLMAQLLSKN